MRGNLRCACPSLVLLCEMFLDLLAARTRCLQILFAVAFDFRLAALTAFDFVAKFFNRWASSERYTAVAYCWVLYSSLGCKAWASPSSVSVRLKKTTWVCSWGAA